VSGKPLPVSNEVKAAISKAAKSTSTGSHVPGTDNANMEGEKKVKTEKELERERKKAEKQAKFDQKKAKVAAAPTATAATSKNKEKKAKAEKKAEEEVLPAYTEETPFGEKKSSFIRSYSFQFLINRSHSVFRRSLLQSI
jgi:valyl-tRNA synthetase